MTTTGDPAGPIASEIAELWWLLLVMGAVVYVVVLALLVAPLLRRRRGDGGPAPTAVPHRAASRWIVGGGVVLPSVVIAVALVASVATMRSIPQSAPEGLVVEVDARQFWWSARYPSAGVSVPNELHIPVGEEVEVRLTSSDVIHSFWVPELAGKLDALPDGTNTLVLLADEPGVYRGRCAEFCGLAHAHMGFLVVAEAPDDFRAWLDAQAEPASEPTGAVATRGAEVFVEADCGRCHTIQGTAADGDEAPALTHVASRRMLAAATLPNTTAALERWLREPGEVKEGTEMPPVELDDDDLAALVAYLETLE